MNFNGRFTQSIDDLVKVILPSLVIIRGKRWGAAAGIIWREDGLILTNNHVVRSRAPIVKLHDDREYKAKIISRDKYVDLAILSIDESHLTPLQPATENPRIGELVFAFGHPWGQRNSVTKGIVSAMLNAETRRKKQIQVIRSDVPLAPGNSGGPLINVLGEVVGINAMIMGGDQSIAIPVPVVNEFIERALSKEEYNRHLA